MLQEIVQQLSPKNQILSTRKIDKQRLVNGFTKPEKAKRPIREGQNEHHQLTCKYIMLLEGLGFRFLVLGFWVLGF